MALLALLSAAVGYGSLRQKVSGLDKRADDQEARIDRVVEAVAEVNRTHGTVGEQIRSFGERQEASHTLLASQISALDRLFTSKIEDVLVAVRRRAQN